jgi:hypothetical protein
MKRWWMIDTDSCPCCGAPEDTEHVRVCTGAGANDIWSQSHDRLDAWMSSVNTDPEL